MKLTIWAPDFKDLPTVKLTLPAKFGNKNVQILYGYTQPSKPYDRTLFVQLVLPIHTTKRTLKSMTTQLRNTVKKSWDKSNYEIVKVDEEFKSYQSFIYFQLKRVHRALVRPGLLSTPLKVPKLKEPAKRKTRVTKKTTKKKTTRKKTAKKKTTRRKSSKSTKRKSSARKATKRKTVRRSHTKKKTTRKKTKKRVTKKKATRKKSSKKKSRRR